MAGTAEWSYAASEVRGGGREELPPRPHARGQGRRREELPRAVEAQEGLEELSHIEGQEGQR